MSKLTTEELEELKALEQDDKERREAAADAAKRQHLEGLRLSRKLRDKHGEPGSGFVVLETKVGNFAVRRPIDVEIDSFAEEESSRGSLEKFVATLVIHPEPLELKRLMSENAGLATALMGAGLELVKVLREEEAKK